MKKLKQHEDKYLHISKETVQYILGMLALIFFALVLTGAGHSIGYDKGYNEGQTDLFLEIENAYLKDNDVNLIMDSGLILTCKERVYSWTDEDSLFFYEAAKEIVE